MKDIRKCKMNLLDFLNRPRTILSKKVILESNLTSDDRNIILSVMLKVPSVDEQKIRLEFNQNIFLNLEHLLKIGYSMTDSLTTELAKTLNNRIQDVPSVVYEINIPPSLDHLNKSLSAKIFKNISKKQFNKTQDYGSSIELKKLHAQERLQYKIFMQGKV